MTGSRPSASPAQSSGHLPPSAKGLVAMWLFRTGIINIVRAQGLVLSEALQSVKRTLAGSESRTADAQPSAVCLMVCPYTRAITLDRIFCLHVVYDHASRSGKSVVGVSVARYNHPTDVRAREAQSRAGALRDSPPT